MQISNLKSYNTDLSSNFYSKSNTVKPYFQNNNSLNFNSSKNSLLLNQNLLKKFSVRSSNDELISKKEIPILKKCENETKISEISGNFVNKSISEKNIKEIVLKNTMILLI